MRYSVRMKSKESAFHPRFIRWNVIVTYSKGKGHIVLFAAEHQSRKWIHGISLESARATDYSPEVIVLYHYIIDLYNKRI